MTSLLETRSGVFAIGATTGLDAGFTMGVATGFTTGVGIMSDMTTGGMMGSAVEGGAMGVVGVGFARVGVAIATNPTIDTTFKSSKLSFISLPPETRV